MNRFTKIIFTALFLPTFYLAFAPVTFAQESNTNKQFEIKLSEPIEETSVIKGRTGTEILKNYIAIVYKWGAGIVGVIAVLVIILSGIQMMMSGGEDASGVEEAKKRIYRSVAGLILLFLSGVLLYVINPNFFTY